MTAPILPVWTPSTLDVPEDGDLTWAYPWPGGDRLAADLPALVRATGLRVGEIGCGRGRCGLTMLGLGAASLVAGDLAPGPVAYVTSALAVNGWTDRGRTVIHRWGDPLDGQPFDLLIGADVLYRPALHGAILQSIAASMTMDGAAILADPRRTLEADLPSRARECGLAWNTVARPGPYTLAIVTRGTLPPWLDPGSPDLTPSA